MITNVTYYGIAVGLGFIFSFFFWGDSHRKIWMINMAIAVPIFWILLMARFDVERVMDLAEFARSHDIRIHMSNRVGRGFGAPGLVWAAEAFFVFGSIWIERNLRSDMNEKAYQGASANGGKRRG